MDEFIAELKHFQITYLMDVRSKPYSKWSPHFNKEPLELELKKHHINYLYAGDSLGGLPQDRTCYDEEGKVQYEVLREKDFFRSGLQRLITANEKDLRVAVMCSESKPEECHRSKLIGQELLKLEISINHIVPGQKLKSQETVMNELTKGLGTTDLFGNDTDFKSRKKY